VSRFVETMDHDTEAIRHELQHLGNHPPPPYLAADAIYSNYGVHIQNLTLFYTPRVCREPD
jgi:hypothetical protein